MNKTVLVLSSFLILIAFGFSNAQENSIFLKKLKKDLKNDHFFIDKSEDGAQNNGVYSHCGKDLTINIKEWGVKWFHIKRSVDEPENYYPDFTLTIFEFKNEDEAQKYLDKINPLLRPNARFCNSKSPIKIVRNKSKIYELQTRAEMFRGYTNDFAEKIKSY